MADFKPKNKVNLVGVLSDYDLSLKEYNDKNTGDPYNAIVGKIVIETGEGNEISLQAFERETFGNGNKNRTYSTYLNWINQGSNEDGDLSMIGTQVSMSTSIDLNIFPGNDGSLVVTDQIRASFINTANSSSQPKAEFSVEALIENDTVPEIKDDVETGRHFLTVNLFDWQGTAFPARFVIQNSAAVEYFDDLEKPVIVPIWGDIINVETVTTKTEESAFGEARVVELTNTRREKVITGASVDPIEIDEGGAIYEYVKNGKAAFETKKAAKENEKQNNALSGETKSTATKKDKGAAKGGFSF